MAQNWLRIGVLAAGAFYLLFPHTLHQQFNLDFGLSHSSHLLSGGILLAFGLFALKKEE